MDKITIEIATFKGLEKHHGHKLITRYYGDDNDPDIIQVECEDCNTAILYIEKGVNHVNR